MDIVGTHFVATLEGQSSSSSPSSCSRSLSFSPSSMGLKSWFAPPSPYWLHSNIWPPLAWTHPFRHVISCLVSMAELSILAIYYTKTAVIQSGIVPLQDCASFSIFPSCDVLYWPIQFTMEFQLEAYTIVWRAAWVWLADKPLVFPSRVRLSQITNPTIAIGCPRIYHISITCSSELLFIDMISLEKRDNYPPSHCYSFI